MSKWLNLGNKVINTKNIIYIEFVQFDEGGLETTPVIKISLINDKSFKKFYRDVRIAEKEYNEIIEQLKEE